MDEFKSLQYLSEESLDVLFEWHHVFIQHRLEVSTRGAEMSAKMLKMSVKLNKHVRKMNLTVFTLLLVSGELQTILNTSVKNIFLMEKYFVTLAKLP